MEEKKQEVVSILKDILIYYEEIAAVSVDDVVEEDEFVAFNFDLLYEQVEVKVTFPKEDRGKYVITCRKEKVDCDFPAFEKSVSKMLKGLEKEYEKNMSELQTPTGEKGGDGDFDVVDSEEESEGEDENYDDEEFEDDQMFPDAEEKIEHREIPFEIYTPKRMKEEQDDMVQKVAELMFIDKEGSKIVLRSYRWNREKIEEIFTDKFREGVLKEVGLAAALFEQKEKGRKDSDIFECPVCYSDVKIRKTSIMPACGHRFCDQCWRNHLTYKINDGLSKRVNCMHHSCNCVVTDSIVEKFITSKEVLAKYAKKVMESYVVDNDRMKWCQSSPHCGNAMLTKVNVNTPLEIKCKCGHEFCFKCLEEPHLPASCTMMTFWKRKCADDSENLNWIKANTRTCPKCTETVFKDGGCNHITCKCGAHWCWACGKVFKQDIIYNHGCNMFKEPDDVGEEDSRAALERYLFYFNHFNTHMTSLKNQKKIKGEMDKKLRSMSKKKQMSAWVEHEWVENAVKVLLYTRRAMMNCYVFAFYLFARNSTKKANVGCKTFKDDKERKSVKEIFEMNQADVEETTEKLNRILDKNLDAILKEKHEVQKLTTLNEGRVHALFDIIKKNCIIEEEYLLPDPRQITIFKRFS